MARRAAVRGAPVVGSPGMNPHDKKPTRGTMSPAELQSVTERLEFSYSSHVRALASRAKDRRVAETDAGRSGYLLRFADGSGVVVLVAGARLDWKWLDGPLEPSDLSLLHQPGTGDARVSRPADGPYASQLCDLPAEVARCIGQPVTGVAIGEDTFNLCFPEDRELDAML